MSAWLTFHGAAGTVPGAKFLVEADHARVLLECGLFQGLRELKARNWAALPVAPTSLAAVLLSHAHIVGIMLPDAGKLQEEEAAYRNRATLAQVRPVAVASLFEPAPGVRARFSGTRGRALRDRATTVGIFGEKVGRHPPGRRGGRPRLVPVRGGRGRRPRGGGLTSPCE